MYGVAGGPVGLLHSNGVQVNFATFMLSLLRSPLPPLYSSLQCIIFLLIRSPRLSSLLTNQGIRGTLARLHDASYVDQDALFDETRNCDYSHSLGGVSRERFIIYYLTFIRECVTQQGLDVSCNYPLPLLTTLSFSLSSPLGAQMDLDQADSFLVTLCFAFTLLGRRMFFQHAQSGSSRRG